MICLLSAILNETHLQSSITIQIKSSFVIKDHFYCWLHQTGTPCSTFLHVCWAVGSAYGILQLPGGENEYTLMIWDPFKDSCKDWDSCTQRKHYYHRWWKRAHLSFYTRQTCVIERSQSEYRQWRSMWYQEAPDWAKVNLIVVSYTDTTARVLQREVLIKDFLLFRSVSTYVQVYLTVCEQQQMPSRGLKLLTPKTGRRTLPRYLPINKHRIIWSLLSSLSICWMCNFMSLMYVCCVWK